MTTSQMYATRNRNDGIKIAVMKASRYEICTRAFANMNRTICIPILRFNFINNVVFNAFERLTFIMKRVCTYAYNNGLGFSVCVLKC